MAFPFAAAASSLFSGALGLYGSHRQNVTAKDMSREQMAFQREMSGTAYQRAMQDMKAAGLNPILAYQQGGASSPSGSMPNISDELAPAISSAQMQRRMDEDIKNLQATNKKLHADTLLSYSLADSAKADQVNKISTAKEAQARTRIQDAQLAKQQLQSKAYGEVNTIYDDIRNYFKGNYSNTAKSLGKSEPNFIQRWFSPKKPKDVGGLTHKNMRKTWKTQKK